MGILYDNPDLFDAAFGEADGEEVGFYEEVLREGGADRGRILSLGCGSGRLEAPLAARGFRICGIDASPAMATKAARRDPDGWYAAACMRSLPSREAGFAAAISGLLSFAYMVDPARVTRVFGWLGRALAPGAPLVLDIPVAHRPGSLQGLEEAWEFPGGGYRFRYFDEVRRCGGFSVLATRIEVAAGGRSARRDAELAVWTPGGVARAIAAEGLFGGVAFHAPYDRGTAARTPPGDCLRAVVVCCRAGDSPCRESGADP